MGGAAKASGMLDVYGGGQPLAFSGLDGPTDYHHGLVLRTAAAGTGLAVVLPGEARIAISDARPTEALLAGDFFELTTPAGRTRGAFLDACHLLMEGPCAVDGADGAVAAVRRGDRTLVASAARVDRAKLGADLDAATRDRRAWLRSVRLPPQAPARRARTLAKALSILKTQVCTGEGRIARRWTTPDRWPHRAMWLWDSGFHAVGWRHIDPDLARETLEAVFDGQRDDGFVPHMTAPDGTSEITQPPVLGLAAQLIEQVRPDRPWLERVYWPLARCLQWDLVHRDADGAGLLEWRTEPSTVCPCGESGMDNSPRFDGGELLDAVDFNAYAAAECEVLAGFAERLGLAEDARRWRGRHRRLCRLINERLWDEAAGLYMDARAGTSERTGVRSSAGFLPLLCGAPDRRRAERLAAHLHDPETFGSPVPVASISPAEASCYAPDMWRGPMWVNVNWLIARGFDRCGLADAAGRLRRRTMDEIERWYERLGSLFEFHDAGGEVPPPQLDRKGPNDPARPYRQVVHDYGWTAALYVDMVYASGD